MNYQLRNYLEKVTNLVRETYNISVPIVNIDEVVIKMNGKIIEVSEHLITNTIEKGKDGCDFIIYVRKDIKKERRNIFIAQSLGVLFLHMGYMSDWNFWDQESDNIYQYTSYQTDFEKDEFACNLLMPKKEFTEYIRAIADNEIVDSYKVSKYFGVPNGVAVRRGKWMGVLRW